MKVIVIRKCYDGAAFPWSTTRDNGILRMQKICNIADAKRLFGDANIGWIWYLLLKHCIITTAAGQWSDATSWI